MRSAWRALAAGLGLGLMTGIACAQSGQERSTERGRLLLSQYQCGSCHVIPGVVAAHGTLGPSLAAFGRRSYIAGHVPNSTESLVRWIVRPEAVVPGTNMPSMGVNPEDARHMAVFLHALR